MTQRQTAAHPAVAKYGRHVNPTFIKLLGMLGYGRVYVRARDVWVWDDEGRQYLDVLAGFGSVNIGHNHPRLKERLRDFLDSEPMNLCHVGPSPHAADLAEKLASLAGPELSVALFSTSGADAVEAGIKLARAATARPQMLYCTGGFHGSSLGTLSVMGEPRMRAPFEKLLPGCEAVPFGDLAALEERLATQLFAAFVVEPIQCEAGVVLPPPGYLSRAQELCRAHGTLLVLDEVQTGLGRTGAWFAFQSAGFVPDILALAKSLGGGVAPIAATLTSPALHQRAYGRMDRFDLHGSTFAGNAFGCAAALETLSILADEGLIENAAVRGNQLLEGLRSGLRGHPLVRTLSGRGLLVGIELGPRDDAIWPLLAGGGLVNHSVRVFGQWASVRLLERGILCQPASQQWNVLRLEPPLTIQGAEVDRIVATICEVLADQRSLLKTLKDVAGRVNSQFLSGWEF